MQVAGWVARGLRVGSRGAEYKKTRRKLHRRVGGFLALKFLVEIRLEETKQLVACIRQTEQPNGGGGERNRRVCRRQMRRVATRGEVSDDEIFRFCISSSDNQSSR